MSVPPGHETWVTRDYGGEGKGLSMSKATLGGFVYHLLRCGGTVLGSHAMAPTIDRSYVQFSVSLPAGRKDELEAVSGIVLERPGELRPA